MDGLGTVRVTLVYRGTLTWGGYRSDSTQNTSGIWGHSDIEGGIDVTIWRWYRSSNPWMVQGLSK